MVLVCVGTIECKVDFGLNYLLLVAILAVHNLRPIWGIACLYTPIAFCACAVIRGHGIEQFYSGAIPAQWTMAGNRKIEPLQEL